MNDTEEHHQEPRKDETAVPHQLAHTPTDGKAMGSERGMVEGQSDLGANAAADVNAEKDKQQQQRTPTLLETSDQSPIQGQDNRQSSHTVNAAASGNSSSIVPLSNNTSQQEPMNSTSKSAQVSSMPEKLDQRSLSRPQLDSAGIQPALSHAAPFASTTSDTPHTTELNNNVPEPSSTLPPVPQTSSLTAALANNPIIQEPTSSSAQDRGAESSVLATLPLGTTAAATTKAAETTASTTSLSADAPPATEIIDPIASYSAWRKKMDTESVEGTQAVMASFLKQHSAYDVLPVSYRQIVLDTTLLVKKALSVLMQYGIVSAPLWDSTKRKFAGMLTATDFINLIQFYYSHSSYTAAIHVEKVIGVPPPELFSLHPLQSLYDACQLLVESRAHRLPLVDMDSETGEEMIVSVLTQYRILKFISMNYQDEKTLRQPLSELKIGIYTDLAVADLSTPVMSVIDMFVKRRISSVPIVDEDGVVLNVFETVDTLVKAGMYRDLDLCVAEALLRRPEDFSGVHTCTLNDSLSSIFGTIRKSQVHRLIVVDSGNKLKGIVSLSDIMRYLITGTGETQTEGEGAGAGLDMTMSASKEVGGNDKLLQGNGDQAKNDDKETSKRA
ncbi:AMP-activated serine/threonine-protein kinase regulatory subunit [Mortierella polycephala]|uniref:AMP-activated serine/threonine-protein kinase regulatory subunit n=1 Tax=Mortierella polycephala TaxID=41804 RepID=A0A9P6Q9K7_9FUNG|nr:AMP-activated serine/threonine-protein kinase regulatory subunit [Mortierella polycephala]